MERRDCSNRLGGRAMQLDASTTLQAPKKVSGHRRSARSAEMPTDALTRTRSLSHAHAPGFFKQLNTSTRVHYALWIRRVGSGRPGLVLSMLTWRAALGARIGILVLCFGVSRATVIASGALQSCTQDGTVRERCLVRPHGLHWREPRARSRAAPRDPADEQHLHIVLEKIVVTVTIPNNNLYASSELAFDLPCVNRCEGLVLGGGRV